MSRDLYLYAEKRAGAGWELAEEPELHVETVFGMETGERWYEPRTLYFESGRSWLFAVLAEPEQSSSPLGSFGPPRGLPLDVSPILRAHSERRMAWSFRHSWLSAAELLAFDWYSRTVPVYGRARSEYVGLFEARGPFPAGVPSGAWAWESHGSPEELRTPMEPGWAPVSWMETRAEVVGTDFPDTVLPALQAFGGPEDVRVVFWFS